MAAARLRDVYVEAADRSSLFSPDQSPLLHSQDHASIKPSPPIEVGRVSGGVEAIRRRTRTVGMGRRVSYGCFDIDSDGFQASTNRGKFWPLSMLFLLFGKAGCASLSVGPWGMVPRPLGPDLSPFPHTWSGSYTHSLFPLMSTVLARIASYPQSYAILLYFFVCILRALQST